MGNSLSCVSGFSLADSNALASNVAAICASCSSLHGLSSLIPKPFEVPLPKPYPQFLPHTAIELKIRLFYILFRAELSIIGTSPDFVQNLEFFMSRLISGFCLDQIKTRFEPGLGLDNIQILVLKLKA